MPWPGGHMAASAVMGRTEPGGQGVTKAVVRAVSDPRDVSVGANQHGSGRSDCAEDRELPDTGVACVESLNPICPWSDVEGSGLAEIEEHRTRFMEQREHPA